MIHASIMWGSFAASAPHGGWKPTASAAAVQSVKFHLPPPMFRPECPTRFRQGTLRKFHGRFGLAETPEVPPLTRRSPQPESWVLPMTWQAKAYLAAVISGGIAVLAAELVLSSWIAPVRFLCYLIAAVIASGWKVSLPGINGTMSVNLIVILISLVELSPAETLVLGCASAMFQSFWHQHRIEPVHVAFNLAQIAISIELSDRVFHQSAQLLGPTLPLRLMATAITYFVANTILVSSAVALTEHRSLLRTWADSYFWSFPNYLVGGAFAWAITWS